MKNIIKEIFIMLLLCVAIVLVLAVIFYDYNPINKEVPKAITYKMPDELSEIKEELNTPLVNDKEEVIRTYELTEKELNGYKKTNYDAGKVNPFAKYAEDTNTALNTITNTITNTTNTNSTGSFFENSSSK